MRINQKSKKYITTDLKRGVDYIGVTCVFYCHDGKGNLLLHKRSNKCRDEIGCWDVGGGSMEFGESFEEAVRREIKEEYCADVVDLKFLGVNNVIRKNGEAKTHWIAVLFAAQVIPEQVKIGEPEKMVEIGWFAVDDLPSPPHSMLLTHLEWVKKEGILKS